MGLQIVKASQLRFPLRMLVYGDSGAGKTYLAMQAHLVEGMTPALLVSSDEGSATARRTDIDVLPNAGPKEVAVLMRSLKKLEYRTVILDGFSEFYDRMVMALSTEDTPTIRDWLKASVNAKKLIRTFVDARINIIVICLAQKVAEESEGVLHTAPLVPGKMAFRFAQYFDIVGYVNTKATTRGEPQRLLQVQPYRRVIAKDRDGTIGAPELDITWKLFEGVPPMQLIWDNWCKFGASDDTPQPITVQSDEIDDEDIDLYERGEEVSEGDF